MTSASIGRMRRPVFGALLALVLTAAAPTTTLGYWLGDEDIDGVVDGVDMCPGTPPLDMVYQSTDMTNPRGCSVCPCNVAWKSHDDYVSCVTKEANRRYQVGIVSLDQRTALITHGQNSTCGNVTVTRCCVWKTTKAGTGTCSIMEPAKCSPQALFVKRAENRGSGSCYYTPCNW